MRSSLDPELITLETTTKLRKVNLSRVYLASKSASLTLRPERDKRTVTLSNLKSTVHGLTLPNMSAMFLRELELVLVFAKLIWFTLESLPLTNMLSQETSTSRTPTTEKNL